MRDTGLHPLFRHVQDGDRRRLRARARRRRDGQQGLQGARRFPAIADRRVDVVHDLTTVRGDERADLRRVDTRAAPDRHEPVEPSLGREVRRLLQRVCRWFHAGPLEDFDLDPFCLDELLDARCDPSCHHAGVRDEHHTSHAHPRNLPARLFGSTRPVLQRRCLQRKDGLVARIAVTAHGNASFIKASLPSSNIRLPIIRSNRNPERYAILYMRVTHKFLV